MVFKVDVGSTCFLAPFYLLYFEGKELKKFQGDVIGK